MLTDYGKGCLCSSETCSTGAVRMLDALGASREEVAALTPQAVKLALLTSGSVSITDQVGRMLCHQGGWSHRFRRRRGSCSSGCGGICQSM